ncbi:sulfurtransferase [Hymenobacter chitinivorans]|uniref:Thiosulfate/3-mercaptopyruvate sulfurtransferase n=1 Tax=Hymenobacter chitinivorans DSM 11115 TaxID=1121954 RepID=A0A2M9BSJ3_9BACT|nr:sulfurtransferase [Hymenobacter chitinivorans]PJJ60915.1 thiosulfate/3-mercaptopyruvate sulfurtransferase [Hymenobacter chitinivorans DSM 11115]
MQPLISAPELRQRQASETLVLLDARSGPEARARYQAAHLPGALFVDLEQDLARPTADAAQGGRHPLPPVKDFAHLLGCLGITPETPVVVYDDKSGANAAARTWWMLRSAGHAAVQVLDGGLPAALAAGFEPTAAAEQANPVAPYPVTGWQLPLAPTDKVREASETGSALIIDVREAPRYRGETEPIDLVAGHIPGAVNVPFAGNLDEAGRYLPAAELRQKYEQVLSARTPEQVIVHCGSGVTACHTLLAFDQAGLPIPRLYVGSWSEWSRNDFPQATGEE